MMRCLIATLGKDAPGTNAVVRASTRLALDRGMEVIGVRRGFLGLLENRLQPLKRPHVGFIIERGGSLLGSTDFRIQPHDVETLGQLARALREFDLVVATGGLGSFAILDRLYSKFDMGIATTMFVPCTVENEFLDPARAENPDGVHAESVGADTAANSAIEAIDRLREQSFLSHTMFLVQCLGAKSNFLPLQIGMACGANRIYLPPYPRLSAEAKAEIRELFGGSFDPTLLDVREMVKWIEAGFEKSSKKYLLAIIPKGIPLVHPSSQAASAISLRRPRGEDTDIAPDYEDIVTSMAPMELTALRVMDDLDMHFADSKTIQVRWVVLDDLQYGGSPTARDRVLGSLYGAASVEEFLSVVSQQETDKRANLNLLAIEDTTSVRWRCFPRQKVSPLYKGSDARAGGVDALPFFRQSRGTVSGYRPWATV